MKSPVLLLFALSSTSLAACTSTELEVPPNHPGHPRARTGQLHTTAALTAAYALEPSGRAGAHPLTPDPHAGHQHGAAAEPSHGADAAQEPANDAAFTCPMHPEIIRHEPGTCPICGMKLVPRKDAK